MIWLEGGDEGALAGGECKLSAMETGRDLLGSDIFVFLFSFFLLSSAVEICELWEGGDWQSDGCFFYEDWGGGGFSAVAVTKTSN